MASTKPPSVAEQSNTEETSKSQAQEKSNAGKSAKAQDAPQKPEAPKLTGAELKNKAKAEKAARRAQALLEKQAAGSAPPLPVVIPGPGVKSEGPKTPKGQHKRAGSAAVEVRNMPIRGGAQKPPPVPETPREEDKTVEFFRHLYKTRTTSIAAAGKDVHPAVLALGLQMSNYTICGSCARLVATLLAFKRVSSSDYFMIWRQS
jgi:translation initiation factor eIF-2B subunit delta